ncbi:MAG: diguanylate cyclase [Acidobacteria bacterium]|nr:diguanylate cyclase [Acidobacteriota bacterium]MBI3656070.1 diguanylate cyclase [Acidobacteriota bacterium]
MHTDNTTLSAEATEIHANTNQSSNQKKILVLSVLSGEDTGREYELSKRETLIGRNEDCEIRLNDTLVSHHHARIEIKSSNHNTEDVVLTDLETAHGTFLNYGPITCTLLKDGDKIMVGATILKFQHKDACGPQYMDEFIKLATTDTVTGLYNKRQILALGEEEFERSRRYRRPLSVILLQLDRVADVQNRLGPVVSDNVLKGIGSTILSSIRRLDKAGRNEPDQFIVILPEAGLAEAKVVGARLKQRIGSLEFEAAGQRYHVAINLGISERVDSTDELFIQLMEQASQELCSSPKSSKG